MKYPTSLEEIKTADKLTACMWYRFCTTSGMLNACNDNVEEAILRINTISDRVTELGGWDCNTSKTIGWDQP